MSLFDNTEFQILKLLNSVNPPIFHGKRTDTGKWVEGNYFTKVYFEGTIEEYWAHIIKDINSGIEYEVHANTVSVYLGFDDKDGNKIFLHDVIMHDLINHYSGIIFYDGKRFGLCVYDDTSLEVQDILEVTNVSHSIIRLGSVYDLTEDQIKTVAKGKTLFFDLFK